jgi:hypothetical protein
LIAESGLYLGELSFDGSNDTLSVATVSTLGIDGSNNKSAFAVARTTAGTDGFVIAGIDGGGSFRGLRYRSNSTNGLARLEVSNFGVEGGDLSDGNNHLYSSIFDGTQTGDFDVSLDGSITQGSGTDVINTDGTSTFFIGTVTSNSDAGFTREFILYASDQTANRFKIESNINNHYTIYTAAQNGFVNTWYDQSGNGFNAVADADENEPKIVNSGSLLTDGVKFSSGNNLKLSGTGLDIFKNIQHAQVFYVIKINDTSTALTGFFEAQKNAFQARFLLRNSNATAGRISLGGRRLDSDAFVSFQSDSGHSNEKIVLTGFINYSDAEAFIFQNGTQIGSRTSFLTAGATSDTRSANIAIGRASASLTAEFDAEELIIFNTDQTANRTAIETNIANEYGITLS